MWDDLWMLRGPQPGELCPFLVCRCCLLLKGKPSQVTLAWSVLGCSAARSAFSLSQAIGFPLVMVGFCLTVVCVCFMCVQHWRDPCEWTGRDQCGSYLCHWISAAWMPLHYRPLSACWDIAGPSPLQRRSHLGTQFGNFYDCTSIIYDYWCIN